MPPDLLFFLLLPFPLPLPFPLFPLPELSLLFPLRCRNYPSGHHRYGDYSSIRVTFPSLSVTWMRLSDSLYPPEESPAEGTSSDPVYFLHNNILFHQTVFFIPYQIHLLPLSHAFIVCRFLSFYCTCIPDPPQLFLAKMPQILPR